MSNGVITILDCRPPHRGDDLLCRLIRREWRVAVRRTRPLDSWLLAAQKKAGGPVEAMTVCIRTGRQYPDAIVLSPCPIWVRGAPEHEVIGWYDRTSAAAVVDASSLPKYFYSAALQMAGLILGRTHCADPLCVMWYPEVLEDIARPVVCPACLKGELSSLLLN